MAVWLLLSRARVRSARRHNLRGCCCCHFQAKRTDHVAAAACLPANNRGISISIGLARLDVFTLFAYTCARTHARAPTWSTQTLGVLPCSWLCFARERATELSNGRRKLGIRTHRTERPIDQPTGRSKNQQTSRRRRPFGALSWTDHTDWWEIEGKCAFVKINTFWTRLRYERQHLSHAK